MDNQRLFLFVALSFVVLMLWQAWVEDYAPPPATEIAATTPAQPQISQGEDLPTTPQAVPATNAELPETELLKSTGDCDG